MLVMTSRLGYDSLILIRLKVKINENNVCVCVCVCLVKLIYKYGLSCCGPLRSNIISEHNRDLAPELSDVEFHFYTAR